MKVLIRRIANCLACPFHVHHVNAFTVTAGGEQIHVEPGYYCLVHQAETGMMQSFLLDRDMDALEPGVRTFTKAMETLHGSLFPSFCPLPDEKVQATPKGKRNLELTR